MNGHFIKAAPIPAVVIIKICHVQLIPCASVRKHLSCNNDLFYLRGGVSIILWLILHYMTDKSVTLERELRYLLVCVYVHEMDAVRKVQKQTANSKKKV